MGRRSNVIPGGRDRPLSLACRRRRPQLVTCRRSIRSRPLASPSAVSPVRTCVGVGNGPCLPGPADAECWLLPPASGGVAMGGREPTLAYWPLTMRTCSVGREPATRPAPQHASRATFPGQ